MLKGIALGAALMLAVALIAAYAALRMDQLPPAAQQAWQQVRNWPLTP